MTNCVTNFIAEYFKDKINTICNRLSCTFDPLYNAPQILPCTSTLTHFTLPTNTAIYNYIVTARCSSPHEPITVYLIKKTSINSDSILQSIIDDSLILNYSKFTQKRNNDANNKKN